MVGLVEALVTAVVLILLYLFYYHMVVKFIDKEMKEYKDWQKRTGMEEIIKQHEEQKKKKYDTKTKSPENI